MKVMEINQSSRVEEIMANIRSGDGLELKISDEKSWFIYKGKKGFILTNTHTTLEKSISERDAYRIISENLGLL